MSDRAATLLVAAALAAYLVGLVGVDVWKCRCRRRARAAVRQLRAQARCAECGAIGRVEFRAGSAELFAELGRSDVARAVRAAADYGLRHAAAGRVVREGPPSGAVPHPAPRGPLPHHRGRRAG